MVHPLEVRATNIHGGPTTDGFKTLKDLYLLRIVRRIDSFGFPDISYTRVYYIVGHDTLVLLIIHR